MFAHRASDFDPRVAAIAGHLRAIESELGALGKSAGRRRMGSDALGQIADQAKRRPLITLAVAIGVGVLIGAVVRRN
ncbi:MAG: hypothetical protein ABSB77_21995 [Xanthobacteraceae bacterium]